MKAYLAVFVSVFLAEIGDKTQLATVLFAAQPSASKVAVFAASAGALCLSSALAGAVAQQKNVTIGVTIPARPLRIGAGVGFVAIGAWLLFTRT